MTMKKRTFVATALAAALMSAGLGTAQAQQTFKLTFASSHPTSLPWVGLMSTLFVPEVNKRVEALGKGYKIEWKEFTSGPPLLEALDAGSIHIGGVGNTPPLFAAAGNSKLRAVQGASYGGTGDAIVVPKDSDIKSVADLEGKSIAVAEGTSANYNLLAQLDKAGVDYEDVIAVLIREGVEKFVTSWKELVGTVEKSLEAARA